MRFRARPRLNLGLIRFNFTERGLSSYSIHRWLVTWNSRTRIWTLNTPGLGYFQFGGRKRRSRQ